MKYMSMYVIIIMSGGQSPNDKKAPAGGPGRKGGNPLGEYTEYGYELDGIEYATINEAYESRE